LTDKSQVGLISFHLDLCYIGQMEPVAISIAVSTRKLKA